eukprot:CAMPEP_0119564852 /NCGR_PEP_ID=MMETSP1352-20130426/28206_1 /TAXON_ID=265584 /ORGANISM="Stauroneis constricta, Strain CCMP1120" /LENGTH=63 /DNA_ID=CAMNT_0007613657 /DNA_START=59 /DNA_END=247 /DNA_ORIENTATION=+
MTSDDSTLSESFPSSMRSAMPSILISSREVVGKPGFIPSQIKSQTCFPLMCLAVEAVSGRVVW